MPPQGIDNLVIQQDSYTNKLPGTSQGGIYPNAKLIIIMGCQLYVNKVGNKMIVIGWGRKLSGLEVGRRVQVMDHSYARYLTSLSTHLFCLIN